ncbi:MAG TPA: hypothetical protein VLG39_07270, partial [Nitrospirota bacterium]|nr:hypothetical protein [Nitrospirota bacterium]
MDSTKQFFDGWIQAQGRIIESMTEMTRKYQESFWGVDSKGGEGTAFGSFPNMFTSWTNSVLNALRETEPAEGTPLRGILSKTLGGSKAYANLYEMWLPL